MAVPIYKNRIRKNVSIDKKVEKVLSKYSAETCIPESRVLDLALKEYFKKYKIK